MRKASSPYMKKTSHSHTHKYSKNTAPSFLSSLFLTFFLCLFAPLSFSPKTYGASFSFPTYTFPPAKEALKQDPPQSKNNDTLPPLLWGSVSSEINKQLDKDQKTITEIFTNLQKSNPSPSGMVLNHYSDQVSDIRTDMAQVLTRIQNYDTIITSILQVVGDKASAGEDPSITAQRLNLQKITQNIKTTMMRAKLYDLQAHQLYSLIETLRSHIEQITLSKKSPSPITLEFWSHLIEEYNGIEDYNGNYLLSSENAHKHDHHEILIPLGILLTFLLTVMIRKIFHHAIENLLIPRLFVRPHPQDAAYAPYPSHEAFSSLLTGIISCALGTSLWFLWRVSLLSQPQALLHILSSNLPICYFIIGSSIPLHHWHKGYLERKSCFLIAVGLISFATIKFIQNLEIIGPTTNNFLEAILGLYSAATLYFISRIHCRAIERNQNTDTHFSSALSASIWSKLLYPLCILIILTTIGAILSGYIAFAFLLNGLLLTIAYAFGITGLFIGAWQQICALFLSPQNFSGRKLIQLGIHPRRLEQMNVLLSAFGSIALLMLLMALIDNNGDYSLLGLWAHLHKIFIGNNIHGVPLSPKTIFNALLLIIGAHYLINFIKSWFSERFFPTTKLDKGLQTSILSILTYCAWILVGIAISTLVGIPIQNLTWVVSALSVGVGFGLQSIVKDFISGLILLAERPVQTGDIIEISGNRGEVRHVNVRATEITLDDGATLIVPNSAFITTNVKNASFAAIPAHLSLNFTLDAESGLEKIRQIIFDIIVNHPMILQIPEPRIRFISLAGANINLTLEVCFAQPKDKDILKDQLLNEIFSRFHAENMTMTMS